MLIPPARKPANRVAQQLDHYGGLTSLHPARSWTVRLRRGPSTVIIGQDLGRFSATALARDLQQLLDPQHGGGPIE